MNPYIDMPLPVGVQIDLGFREPEEVDPLYAEECCREVRRALNAWYYETECNSESN